jgi:hypothetical protein
VVVEVIVLLAFVGLMLVAGALLMFGHMVRGRDVEFADRIALLAIADDDGATAAVATASQQGEDVITS